LFKKDWNFFVKRNDPEFWRSIAIKTCLKRIETFKLFYHAEDICCSIAIKTCLKRIETIKELLPCRSDNDLYSYKDLFKKDWNMYSQGFRSVSPVSCIAIKTCLKRIETRDSVVVDTPMWYSIAIKTCLKRIETPLSSQ